MEFNRQQSTKIAFECSFLLLLSINGHSGGNIKAEVARFNSPCIVFLRACLLPINESHPKAALRRSVPPLSSPQAPSTSSRTRDRRFLAQNQTFRGKGKFISLLPHSLVNASKIYPFNMPKHVIIWAPVLEYISFSLFSIILLIMELIVHLDNCCVAAQ